MTRYIFLICSFLSFSLTAQDLSWGGQLQTAFGDDLGEVTISLQDVTGNIVATTTTVCGEDFTLTGLTAGVD
ncbi:MAG: hypothetical protein AAGJ82_09705, partial [Bacteroidota bacterium]